MSTDSNMGYNHDAILASVLNRHSISFQSGAVNSSSSSAEMIPNSYGGVAGMSNVSNSGTNLINNNTNNNLGFVNSGLNSSGGGGLNYESVSGLNHDLELAVDWSLPEQSRLEDGLLRYADVPSIMRYIKIAALLPDKTVRDVALRCRWMTKKENGKRRKQEEHYMGKKVKDRKSSSQLNLPPSPALNMSAYSLMAHHMDQSDHISCEVLGGRTRHLLGENIQILSQIKANLETFKIHDNVNLFCHTRNNLAAILNNLRDMPGIMSQMPPLPVSINEDLVNSILPHTAMFGSANGFHMKQEPRC
ncbi:hypothetical protein MKW92_050594 [Papaver armeniacum]|nr:hypothetical protein MKW92_050594 [Papaver armeniacum]